MYKAPASPLGKVVVVTLGPAVTVMDKGLPAEVLPALSVTATLNENGLPVDVEGVPLITPVEAASVSPGGRDPLLNAQLV